MPWRENLAAAAIAAKDALINGAPYARGQTYLATTSNGTQVELDFSSILEMPPAELWQSQPYLRAVVDFLARNVAQLGLQVFERLTDLDRVRDTTGVAPLLLGWPNPTTTRYELVQALVSDLALYDNAYWYVHTDANMRSGWRIDAIPTSWVIGTRGGDLWGPAEYQIAPADGTALAAAGQQVWIKASDVLHFHGWDPLRPAHGVTAVQTLKLLLLEQIYAAGYRQQVWKRGGRAGSVITRPANAPAWSETAKHRFETLWRAAFTGPQGPQAGGTPLLEDGMELKQVGFSAHEDEYVEGAKLALTTVCSVYHVNPTMLGLLDNANYSNVREFRRMLYGDTLGPWLAMLENRINTFLLPKIGAKESTYVEFNINEKLQGSFEEQASVLSTMVGAPIMTRNEGRAKLNLSPIDDPAADELITPLNVTEGGQASPQTPTEVPGGSAARPGVDRLALAQLGVKERGSDSMQLSVQNAMASYFSRQANVVLSKIGAKAATPDWWDAKRWNAELTEDLYRLSLSVTAQIGAATALSLGFSAGAYNPAATLAFLQAVAASRAESINAETLSQLKISLGDNPPEGTMSSPTAVFDEAKTNRSALVGASMLTLWSSFASTESAKQAGGPKSTKTWITTSRKPRASHAALNGQTVPVGAKFSNGADWPGDPVLGAAGVSGCLCTVEVNIP